MGLLSKGTPLDWDKSRQHHAYVKYHGILQFLNVYAAQRNRADDTFLWGDEVEHILLYVTGNGSSSSSYSSSSSSTSLPPSDHGKRVQLSLRAAELIDKLEEAQDQLRLNGGSREVSFLPEYGRFMIEATPGRPYAGFTADLRTVEANMRQRRSLIEKLLTQEERVVTLTTFPLMGCDGFVRAADRVTSDGAYQSVSESDYIVDEIIGAHPRFATLSRNIRTRRGAKVDIRIPLYQDTYTSRDMPALIAAEEAKLAARIAQSAPGELTHPPRPVDLDLTKHIHMDAMAFGMGNCCLQVTFQCRDLNESRHLYDHLAVLSPIMLALTAASPFFHGKIADIDARWTVISQSVDDRTLVERGMEAMPDGTPVPERNLSGSGPYQCANTNVHAPMTELPTRTPQRLYKSRYDSISTYISTEDDFNPSYNDIPCEIDEASYALLLSNGIDELLSRHISHLFTRDPLVIYDEHIHLDDAASLDHFENLQSTNWQTVRFKPPTPGSNIGWRVEFRTMEIQLTDFENAAFTVFITLVSRAILYFNLNFYIPLSKVDHNLERAHHRDAVNKEKFFWRKNIQPSASSSAASTSSSSSSSTTTTSTSSSSSSPNVSSSDAGSDVYEEMSIREIMLGGTDATSQPGLINLVRRYLDMIECDQATRTVVDEYLDFIALRSSGELMTTATWLRQFVSRHPKYEHNSILNDDIVYDIVATCDDIVKGKIEVPQLLGKHTNIPKVMNSSHPLGGAVESRELKGVQIPSTSTASLHGKVAPLPSSSSSPVAHISSSSAPVDHFPPSLTTLSC